MKSDTNKTNKRYTSNNQKFDKKNQSHKFKKTYEKILRIRPDSKVCTHFYHSIFQTSRSESVPVLSVLSEGL